MRPATATRSRQAASIDQRGRRLAGRALLPQPARHRWRAAPNGQPSHEDPASCRVHHPQQARSLLTKHSTLGIEVEGLLNECYIET
jgi:hypothetical protein